MNLLRESKLEPGILGAIERQEPDTTQMGTYRTLTEPATYLAGVDVSEATQVHFMPATVDGLAQAFPAIRAGQLPDEPALPVVNEAAVDPSSVPQGASSLKIF